MDIDTNEEVSILRELYAAGEKKLIDLGDDAFVAEEAKWSPAQHLQHLVLANASITRLIPALKSGKFAAKSAPAVPERLEKLYEGWFPSGGTSPENIEPSAELEQVELFDAWRESIQTIEGLKDKDWTSEYRLEHMFYGPLNPAEWLKFMGIHTKHHLKIIGAVT